MRLGAGWLMRYASPWPLTSDNIWTLQMVSCSVIRGQGGRARAGAHSALTQGQQEITHVNMQTRQSCLCVLCDLQWTSGTFVCQGLFSCPVKPKLTQLDSLTSVGQIIKLMPTMFCLCIQAPICRSVHQGWWPFMGDTQGLPSKMSLFKSRTNR